MSRTRWKMRRTRWRVRKTDREDKVDQGGQSRENEGDSGWKLRKWIERNQSTFQTIDGLR